MSNQREKFFAQYWGQEVAVIKGSLSPYLRNTRVSNLIYKHLGYPCIDVIKYLELTPLSQISNKDLKTIGFGNIGNKKLHFVFDDYDTHWKSSCGNWGTLLFKDFDYLRSKGYALPWMGISVEEQIKRGWVKLKTDSNE